MLSFDFSLLFRGVSLDVEGTYTQYVPARLTADPYYSTPAEGGIDELYVKLDGVDVTDWLTDDTYLALREEVWDALT